MRGLVPDHVMLAEEVGVVDVGDRGFSLGRGLGRRGLGLEGLSGNADQ